MKTQVRRKTGTFQKHPKDNANWFTHFFFCWQLSVLAKRRRKEINESSILVPVEDHESGKLGTQLEKMWSYEENFSKKPSLTRALIKLFGKEFLFYGLLYFPFDLAITLLQPFSLKKLLDCLSSCEASTAKKEIFLYGSLTVLTSFLHVLCFHIFFLQLFSFGIKVRVACCSLIYRRMLNLKKSTQRTTAGQIINLLSNDVERFERVFAYSHYIWMNPVKLLISVYFLISVFDYRALIGIVVPVLAALVQTFIYKKISSVRRNAASKTDYRLRLIISIVDGIQAIKMYTWEKLFGSLVQSARSSELGEITKANHYRVTNQTIGVYPQKISIFFCILVTVLYGVKLTPEYVFALANIYELLRVSSQLMSTGVIFLSEIRTSIQRIGEFLLTFAPIKSSEKISTEEGVLIKNVSTKWNSSSKYALTNVTIAASSSELVAIVGGTGSGKSTLLQVVLEELEVLDGSLSVAGTISYAPQEPWIFSASIQENILFGEEMKEEKYRQVLRACALEKDITLFPFGDKTLVGDRGMMLSGGQKTRISLARAIYRDADVYLLDDPLSAVDVQVADQIFKECFLDLLKHKCVILVTHQIRYLKSVDNVYFLEDGKIVADENFNNLEGLVFRTFDSEDLKLTYESPSAVEENKGSGTVNTYRSYCLLEKNLFRTCLVFLLFAFVQVLSSGFNYFLSIWVNISTNVNCLYFGGTLLIVIILFSHVNTWVFVKFCKNSSKCLHDTLFQRILSGSMKFFNEHSSGRVLNRFSQDIGVIDEVIPMSLAEMTRQFCLVIGGSALIMISNYWMVVPTLILYLLVYLYTRVFQPTISYFKRVEGTRRSPIFNHLSASFEGLTVIRAFKAQRHMQNEFDEHLNFHSSVSYLHRALYFALAFWTDFTTASYSAVVSFCLLSLKNVTNVGTIALAITQSAALVGIIQYGLKLWGDLETQMTSVERVVEYTDLTPEEDHGILIPPDSWPEEGKIVFDSVSMRYSPDKPLVLTNLNLTIQASDKIGIVGRTGAGKSSLISVLFRFFDFEGTIFIDGVDTKSTPLVSLRSKIAIIPQEPVLFLGTLRKNLDPFEEFSDFQLWAALECVGLKNCVSSLDYEISERGSNFSVGQRQLLCLVRAILKNSKIIVLDEATANVDLKSDELIQSVLRKRFRDCTVLTIAHRLETVMDSDKILVMDSGNVAEFGATEELLKNTEGHFYKYVNHGGDQKN